MCTLTSALTNISQLAQRIPGAKTIKKNTNSTQNKSQTHRAKQYKVTSFLSTDCELSTETCSKNVYSLGPWTTWKALNRLRSQVGRSRVNMLKWGFSNEQETCDCGIRQTMQHLLVCPMMDTACSPQDLATANSIAIGCAKHWEGTI